MEAVLEYVFLGGEFLIGLLVMVLGTYMVVQAAKWLADTSGLSDLFVGATLLSLLTVALELFVCFSAVGQGWAVLVPTIVVGVVLVNFGITMALSIISTESWRQVDKKKLIVQVLSVVAVVAIFRAVAADYLITRLESWILMGLGIAFIAGNWLALKVGFWNAPKKKGFKLLNWAQNKFKKEGKGNLLLNVARVVMGLILVLIAAGYLLRNNELIARQASLSRQFLAGTLVAWAVALPVLITAITVWRKQQKKLFQGSPSTTANRADLSLGNILGVNLMSLSLVIGLCAWLRNSNFLLTAQKWAQSVGEGKTVFSQGRIFAPDRLTSGAMRIEPRVVRYDLAIILAFCVILLVPTLVKGKIYRWQGVVMFLSYLTYLIWLFV